MRRDEVLARLKSAEPALRASGVAALYLFGSHARDEAGDDSDIDVFVDPAPDVTFGFLPFMAAYEAIEAAVGGRVDMAPAAACIRSCVRRSSGTRSGCSESPFDQAAMANPPCHSGAAQRSPESRYAGGRE